LLDVRVGSQADPLEDLNVIVDFEENMDLIMKGGVIHRNALQ